MWEKIFDFGKQIFVLTQKQQKHDEAIAKLQQDFRDLHQDCKDLRQDMNTLRLVVERLVMEMQKDREAAQRERENLLLRLEVAFLRAGRTLPPGSDSDLNAGDKPTP